MEKNLTLTERKRLAILQAAQQEFKKKGFLGASMDSLAKRAQVSKRTVYNHFPSKDALFQAIVAQLCESFSKISSIPYQPEQPLAEQLLAIAISELKLLQSKEFRDLNRIILAEFIRSPELASKTMEQLDQQEWGINTWLTAAINDGKLKAIDVDYAGNQFIGLIKSTAFWPQLLCNQDFPTPAQQQQIAKDAVMMFLARYQVEGNK